MRIRTVKPEFFLHDALFEAERSSGLPIRLAFIGIWCACDREGRFQWEPRRLGMAIMPYDCVDFSAIMDRLEAGGWLTRYEANGKVYGEVPSFATHQIINSRESPSRIPGNPSQSDASATRRARVEHASCDASCDASQGEGKGRGREKEGNARRARDIITLWNSTTSGTSMQPAQATPGNINRIAAIIEGDDRFEVDFALACEFVKADDFYNGAKAGTFVTTLDFMLKRGKAAELAEKQKLISSRRPVKHMLPDIEV